MGWPTIYGRVQSQTKPTVKAYVPYHECLLDIILSSVQRFPSETHPQRPRLVSAVEDKRLANMRLA